MSRRHHSAGVKLASIALATALALASAGCSLGGSPDVTQPGQNPPSTGQVPSNLQMPLAGKVEPPASGAYLGAYIPPAPFTINLVDTFQATTGKRISIAMWYQPWATDNRSQFDPGACVAVMRRGKVPMISWEPWDPGNNANVLTHPGTQPAWTLARINAGAYDDYIHTWAQQIHQFGAPIMLRPMHEMNGDWYPWAGPVNGNNPQQFVQAWKHIHDIFEQEGATNVTWVWSINAQNVPATATNTYSAYYPGSAYVDWVAISGFNWGTSRPTFSWRTFSQIYSAPLAFLKTLNKPIMLAEISSVEQGGNKAAWIADAFKRIQADPAIKAVIFFDSLEQGGTVLQDWRVNTTPASLSAFRAAVASPYFVGGPPPALTAWVLELTPTDWLYLISVTPIY